jgi:titin
VNTKSISTGTIRVFLTDSSNSAFNNVYYHYSTNGSTYTNSNVLFTGNGNYQFDVSGLTTQTTTYTIYVRAQNSAGNSNAVSTSPLHVFGNLPVISSVSPVLGAPMNLRVLHSQTPFKGTSPVTYFYSRNSDGSNRTAATDSSFVITDASQTTTIYVIASNSAGNLISAGVSGTPYLLGDKPTIDSITPSIGNLVTVNFTQSNVGNGNPVYYYGFQGSGVRTDASAVSSPLVIRNLTNTTPYSIYLVARNEAGDISSNSYSGVNVLGSKPVITGITKNIGNSVTVAFTQSQKGTDTTIYYYSLDGTNVSLDASATASPIIIPGLTNDTSYNISIVANNPAGNVFSDASTGITILGEQISLTAVAVENIDKTVRLTYTQTNKGTLPVMYYYTTVNNVNTTALTAFPADSNTVDISNVSETTTYYAISSNSAGNIISTGATVTPNTLGDIPTISAVPVLNSPGVVRLEYLQSNAGNAVTTYFYSTSSNKDTTSKTIFSTNPIDVSGVTELTTYYVIASSSAGNVISSGTSVTPYLLGSNPTISDIIPSVGNSITVTFTQTNPGVDAPIYYYSFDGSSVSLDASATVSPLVITGLTNTTPPYTIYLVAKNNAGNIFSDAFSGVNILGTEPTIGTITKNIGNSVTVSFTQLQKGTDTTVYYGSTDGFTAILDASSSSSNEPLTIRNLNNASPYSIYLIARNPAGDVPSIVSSGIHILGTKPVITNITRNIGNSITVDFTQSQKGTDTTVYYGSIDGTNAILDASSSGTSLTIPNLTDVSAYNISIIARNPAGDVVSDPSLNVSILGTQPSFTLVPQTNNLRGTITQTQKGTLPVTYYYSSDGINKEFEVSFPTFNISGTTSRTFYIIVDNSAGQVVSSPVSETPFTFGTIPSISSVIPGYQTLTVNFSQDQTGTTPVKYYYSYNPSGTTRIAEVNPPFFNISGTQPRTVYIVVDNSAGTLVSEGVSGTPYIFGTTPLITLIQRGSQKITVTFTQTSKGTEPVKYYYSFDRVNRISEVTTNTFDILYEVDSRIGNKTYNVAVSEGLYSFSGDASGNNPNFTVVKGSILTFNVNSLGHPLWIKTSNITGTDYAVTTDISNNGTQSGTIVWNTSNVETGTYYYICQYHSSMFGSITIIHPENNPLTTAKNVSIIADNSAGTLVSDDVSGTPYTFGSVPVIQSVTPGPNKLTVLFSQDTLGNTPSSYSYSFDASGTNPTAIDSSNTIIVNGSQPRTIYVIATNLAGSLISTGVSGTPFVVGDTPSIDDVVAGPYSLTVKFSQQNAGNTPVTYYYSYSVDGSNPQGPVSLPEFTVTASTQTTIYVVADSLSGYLVSSGFTKTPFVFGDNPVINDPIVPGAETLTVSFTQSPKGTEPVTYYYSFLSDGSGRIGPVTSPFTISTTITRTIYVVASNLAGNLVSSGKTATPYTFANEPVITDIVPSPYNLKVYFTPSTTGTTPITYYYSEFENGSNPVGPVTSPFDISGSIERTIYIIADNSAGNVVSIGFTRKPYIFGTVPVIDSIVPGPNKMTVSFTSSVNGTEPVYHYYSYDSSGSNGVLTTSPFVITGTSTRTVYIVANNPAGNLVSTGVSGTPFIVGGIPIIESVISQTNNLRVTFSHPEPGNTAVTYYYSNDASGNNLIEQVNLPTFDISGTVTRTIYVVSINSAGKLVSEPVIATPFIFGTVPVIESVTPGTEKLSVKFRQDQTGSTPITYYYSFLSDGSNAIGPIDTSFNFAETLPRTIYIVARNAAGDLISSGVSGTPFVYGSKPIITGLQPGLNRLTVSFTQTTQGTTPVQYYYSEFSNGSNRVGPVTSPFDISNIDTLKTVYIVADNSAGIVVSDASSATPYKLGTNPVVSAIVPGTNKLTVSFSQSSKGTEPVTYYYSELSDGTSRVGPVTSPFDISNILVSKTVYIIAENSGGTLISLSDASGTPYIFGTTSSITNVEPGTNSLTVSFNPSTGGTTPITNYYSYSSSGIPRVAQIQSGASTFTISGIYESKTVYIVSENPAGNLVSAGVSGTPYIFGQIPTISSVTPGTNKLVVNFSQSNKGTLPVTYYYSFNGSGRLGTVTTPSFEIATTVERTVYIIADNSAGTLVSEGVSGTPYIFGSALSVNLSSPISNTIRVSYSQATQGTTPTTYKYVLNGGSSVEVSTNPNGVFDISGLTGTSPYSVYMIASNAAGDLSSNTLTQPVLGTQPTISSVTPETNKLVVNFSQSNIGTLPVTYYYSFNGSVRLGTVTTPSFEIATTVERTVYIIADNSAGTLVSAGVSGTPYIVGVPPTVSIESGVNEITVYFSNTGGTAPITYYYSYESDGSTQIGPVTSPFNINNITTATTIYIVANNIAGTIISNAVTGIPYVVGSAPVINSIRSGTNSLIVDFSGSIGGVPSPYAYYYSLDEGNYVLARSLTSPITIEVMIEKQYTVRLIAQNAAGFTLPSNLEVGFPTYKQPILNINSSPPKDANADSGGSFAQNKFMFLKTYSPPPTTLENQQIQVKKKLIGSGRRSSEDVIRQRRIAAVGTSFNATGGDFSIMETSSNVTRRVKFRR